VIAGVIAVDDIVDGHHHIWRRTDLPWLVGPMQPRIFGPYEPIRRDYPIEEFCADLAGCGVTRSVYVQANWAAERFEDEVAWVQRTADESGWPHAIVGYADLMSTDVRPQLDALAHYPLMRGVRMQLHWHENQAYRFAARPDLCTDPVLIDNVRRLADYGWTFELQVFSSQMEGAAVLAETCPQVTFVLQHAGMLEDLSPAGREAWRSGLRQLAARPNVVTKLSGFGTFIHRNDPGHIAWIVAHSVALFGAQRCLFGSNFPIEKLWTGYKDLLDAHLQASAALTPQQRASIFGATARRVYRISG
jgi:predicted TIM-barrel fold metal-dependent hydrolase